MTDIDFKPAEPGSWNASGPDYPLWKAALPAWVLLTILFLPLLDGRIPLNADWLAAECAPWNIGRRIHIGNPDIDDPILQYYPLFKRARTAWRTGKIPLWNPDIACGMPLLADCHSMPLDPLLLSVCPITDTAAAWGILLATQLFILAAVTAAFLKLRGCSPVGASAGSMALVLSGACMTWLQMRLFTSTLLWFMAGLWAVERFTPATTARRAIPAGIALAGMTVSGHLQFIAYGWILLLAFSIHRNRIFNAFPAGLNRLGPVLMQALWGILLSAVFWLPAMELLTRTLRGQPGRYFPLFRFGWVPWISMICPDFLGHPATRDYFGLYIYQKSYANIPILYIGLIPFLFMVGALLKGGPSRRFFAFSTIAILGGLTLLNWSPVRHGIFRYFPSLFSLDPGRLALLTVPLMAVLAADGLTDFHRILITGNKPGWTVTGPAWMVFILVLVVAAGVAVMQDYLFRTAPDNSLSLYLLKLHQSHGTVLLYPPVLKTCLLAAAFLAVVRLSGRMNPGLIWSLLGLLVAADLLPPARMYNPFVYAKILDPPASVRNTFPHTGPSSGRICGIDPEKTACFSGRMLPPNTGLILDAHDFRGYVSAYIGRYAELLNQIQRRTYFDRRLTVPSSPVYDAAGVRWLVYGSPRNLPGLKPVHLEPGWSVYENLRAFPRVWITRTTRILTSPADMMDELDSGRIDLSETAYIESPEHRLPAASPGDSGSGAELTGWGDHYLAIRTETERAGILVVGDSCYPGWRAGIDGRAVEVFPVDCLFRGIRIPPGVSRVTLEYRPMSFLAGEFCFLSAILMICGLIVTKEGTPP
ncbi:hypothetical protein JXA40_03360 [bacterium]|nr:hypothetical protein [candidate division CSSED10-310 bacterium]